MGFVSRIGGKLGQTSTYDLPIDNSYLQADPFVLADGIALEHQNFAGSIQNAEQPTNFGPTAFAAPTGTDKTLTIPTHYTLLRQDFGFADADSNAFASVTIASLATTGTLFYDSNGANGGGRSAVTVGQTITIKDILAGKLSFVASGTSGSSFTFQVQDNSGSGNLDLTPNTLTFAPVASNTVTPSFGTLIDLTGLAATDGFTIQGDLAGDFAGHRVSSAGDVNGDGFADIVVGAYRNDSGGDMSGAAYVLFGKASGFGTLLDLTGLAAADGFRIQGDLAGDLAGRGVASAGDINGDGFADILIGADGNDSGGDYAGAAYVIFGKAGGFGTVVDLTGLVAANGFKIQGHNAGDRTGYNVSSAGDVNGDGFADILVGAYRDDSGGNQAGAAYVIFGKASGFGAQIDLTGLAAANGFKIRGAVVSDAAGRGVSSAGDVNGDGFADILIGSIGNDSGGISAGAAYVIFGKASGFGTLIDLAVLAATDGFKIQADVAGDNVGRSMSAGDVNGDGFSDILIGADRNDSGGSDSGAAYVIFGKASGFGTLVDLTGLAAADGFKIQGDLAGNQTGFSVSSAGDVNGDGLADILIGALNNDSGGNSAGAAYVIFGKTSGFGTLIDLTGLAAVNGFKIQGDAAADQAGRSVSAAGDVNGDGFADILVGGINSDIGGVDSGAAYVIFGRANLFSPTTTNASAAESYTEDTPLDLIDIVATDLDSATVTATLTLSNVAAGTLSTGTSGAVTATYDAATGVWSASGATADVNALLAGVTFNPAANFNGTFTVATSISDGATTPVSGSKIFTGIAVNDAPAGADATVSIPSNYALRLSNFGFTDVDGDRLTAVTITTLPGSGTLYYDSNGSLGGGRSAVTAGQTISAADIAAGKLSFVGTGGSSTSLTFQVQDTGGTTGGGVNLDQSPNTLTFEVLASNAVNPLFGALIDLTGLSATDGFTIEGDAVGDLAGRSVSSAGDVNGDGFADILVGAYRNDSGRGAAYVVFGKADGFGTLLDLSGLAAADGFKIGGDVANDYAGRSVSSAGDINGDGFADILVGADGRDGLYGSAYVIFGKASGFGSAIQLNGLSETDGFRIRGEAVYDQAGYSVSSAGDVNGDGFADILVGAFGNDSGGSGGGGYAGAAYVVFGKAGGFGTLIDLAALAAADGFKIQGDSNYDRAGHRVSSAGDVNGDGFADIVVGAFGNDLYGNYAGAAYVIFGKASGFGTLVDLTGLAAADGFKIQGDVRYDRAGRSVSSAGDVNGDGFADILVGADSNDSGGINAGAAYVIFGKASGFGTQIDLAGLAAADGFKIEGDLANDEAGFSVSSAGDVNGDGFADILVGASGNDSGGSNAGAAYVIFGKASGFGTLIDLAGLAATDGFKIQGDAAGDLAGRSVSAAGDVNGDGFADIMVGASNNGRSGGGVYATLVGAAYVIYGRQNVAPPTATNLNAAESYTEDTPLDLIDIVASDVDSTELTATLTLSDVAAGALSTGTSGAVTATFDPATGVWSATGLTADVNALLAGVTFNPAANFNGNFTVAVSISDGVAPAVTGSKAFTGIAANDAPSFANLQGDSGTITEGVAGQVVLVDADGNALVTDIDSANFNGGTLDIRITSGFVTGEDRLGFVDTARVTIAGNFVLVDGSAIGTFTGGGAGEDFLTLTLDDANPDRVQEVLRAVFQSNSAAEPTGGVRGLTITLTDGDGSTAAVNAGVTVVAVNDAPVFAPGTGSVTRVSMLGDGTNANGASTLPFFLNDGARVVFLSGASNLVAGDTNGAADVFLKDLTTGAYTRVSVDAGGNQANGNSAASSASFGGNRVAFSSNATNLLPIDTNGITGDAYVKDLTTGEVFRADTDANGVQSNGNLTALTISADGRYVALASSGTNLVAGDTNGVVDVFVKDLQTGAIVRVNTDANGVQANASADAPVFSPDGRSVAFTSTATNLVPGDTDSFRDIFVKNLDTGAIFRVGVGIDGLRPNNALTAPIFSPDGSKIAFTSTATNLVDGDTNSTSDLFVITLATGEIVRVNTTAAGAQSVSTASSAVFSPDGTKIAFLSSDSFVPGDSNGTTDLYLKDLITGEIVLVSIGEAGVLSNSSATGRASFSPDGTRLMFTSFATNVVPGDTNNVTDIFIKDLLQPSRYVENGPPAQILSSIVLSDVDSPNFDGGALTVAITADSSAGDRLTIASTGTNTGIDVVGTSVRYDGVEIGVLTDGGTSLTIALGSDATAVTVKALVAALRFDSTAAEPGGATRTISFSLGDGDGGTTSFTTTVAVTPVDDPAVAVADPTNMVDENTTLAINVLANDTDIDGGPRTIASIAGQAASVGMAITLASGATATLNADGTITYDPNGRFNALISAATAAQTGATNTSATDSFSYTLAGGSAATVSVTVNGVDGSGDQLRGSAGNDAVTGTNASDIVDLSQGGNDGVSTGGGNDAIFFGASFGAGDQVDGGAGANDQLGLQGDYTGGNALTLGGANVTGVETVALLAGFDYSVTALDDLLTTAGQKMTIFGGGLGAGDNLTFDGSAETSGSFLVYGGLGTDLLSGGGGNDGFQFAAGRFDTATDVINGGSGNDQVALNGFSGTLSGANLISVETVVLLSGSNTITLADDWTLGGQSHTVFGSGLTQGVTIDGSAESDGKLALYGGSGNDLLTGGEGNDMIIGGGGADTIRGGLGADFLRGDGGADIFVLGSAAESTSTTYDTLVGFDASVDRIDLPNAITAIDTAITVGTLSSGSFDSDLSAALAGLGANHAITFTANQGDLAGRIFLIADTNGIAGYQAGQDAVFELVNPVQPIIDPTPFI